MEGFEGDMSSKPLAEPDGRGAVLDVGRDSSGRWLEQDSVERWKGHFASRGAARCFVEAARRTYDARLEIVTLTLVPPIAFVPERGANRALPLAA